MSRAVAKGVSDADLTAAKQKAKYAIGKRQTKDTKVARVTATQQLTQGSPSSYEQQAQVGNLLCDKDKYDSLHILIDGILIH